MIRHAWHAFFALCRVRAGRSRKVLCHAVPFAGQIFFSCYYKIIFSDQQNPPSDSCGRRFADFYLSKNRWPNSHDDQMAKSSSTAAAEPSFHPSAPNSSASAYRNILTNTFLPSNSTDEYSRLHSFSNVTFTSSRSGYFHSQKINEVSALFIGKKSFQQNSR